jgi:hypothetical protein
MNFKLKINLKRDRRKIRSIQWTHLQPCPISWDYPFNCLNWPPNMKPRHVWRSRMPVSVRCTQFAYCNHNIRGSWLKWKNRWHWLCDALIIHCLACIVAEPTRSGVTSWDHGNMFKQWQQIVCLAFDAIKITNSLWLNSTTEHCLFFSY